MALFSFLRREAKPAVQPALTRFLEGYSVEVMPRTAAKIADFRTFLPQGTRVYVVHVAGTPIEDMIVTARRLTDEGFVVMPHLPARIIPDRATLAEWLSRYRNEAGILEALLLAGGLPQPVGDYHSSMQLLESGLFDGFARLHVAGHPEGNRDIDPDGSDRMVMEAARWKSAFTERTDAQMAMVTQFCFEAGPVIDWANRLRAERVGLPVHIGVAGPAKLQTLLKFALSCGVGPSLRVLQKRAMDVSKLLLPYEPTEFLTELAAHKAAHPDFAIERVHFFPMGGIEANADWIRRQGGQTGSAGR